VHDARLDLRLRINGFNGLGEATQAIDDSDQDIVQPTIRTCQKFCVRGQNS